MVFVGAACHDPGMKIAYCPRCNRYGDSALVGAPCPVCKFRALALLVLPDGYVPADRPKLRVKVRAA